MEILKKAHREIPRLTREDCFLVFDREKDICDFPVHYHSEMELNFISNGQGIQRVVGDSVEKIDNLELVLIGSKVCHGWLQDCPPRKMREITIQFHHDLLDKTLLNRSVMKPIKHLFERSAHGVLFSKEASSEVMPRLLKVSKLGGIDNFMEIMSILYDLANSRNQRLLSTVTVQQENIENNSKVRKLNDYIQENFASKMTLTEVAELLNMSNVSFNRFIKKSTGKTFVEYLNDVRISYASSLLIEKDIDIAEIANMCGFKSIANFNKVFKKCKDCTPSQYRNDFSGIKRIF